MPGLGYFRLPHFTATGRRGHRAELGNPGRVLPQRQPGSRRGAMAQDACITPRELFDELLPSAAAVYSETEVIGEKLRALYDDAAQTCPARMMQLLHALDTKKSDCELTQIPHLGTIN